jgi:hypothetical protein
MGAITEIFRTFGHQYLAQYPDMPLEHKKTINAIINCRSGEFGVVVYRPPDELTAVVASRHGVAMPAGNHRSQLHWA